MARKRSSRAIDILAAAAHNQSRHDDEPDGSGSGSESKKLSGSDPHKPIEQDTYARKSSHKRSLPKRRRLDESEGLSKNARVVNSGSVNRLWSEQDEIGILQGMIDFRFRKGEDPYSDMNAFHKFVQDLISVHVSKKQLTDKIRKLKGKYLANAGRGNVGSVMAHDNRLFELSKMIWGGDGANVGENGGNGNVDVVKNGVEVDDEEDGNVVENGGNGKVDVAGDGVEVGDDNEDEDDGNVVENGVNGMVDVAENGVEDDEEEEEGGNVVENGVNGMVDVDDEDGENMVENGVNGKVDVAENGVEVEDDVNGKVDVAENGVEVSDDKKDKGKDFKEMYPYLSTGWESDVSCTPLLKNYLMDNINLVGSVKLSEMDKNWKNLYAEELKLYVKKLELAKEHAQAVLDQLATSDS